MSIDPVAALPRVAIVVLNWNGRHDTLACLASLSRLTYRNVEVIVVDNGSTDGSADAIRAHHPEARLLCTGRNLGYAAGNNVGLRACLDDRSIDYVLVLNNDTEVDPGLVEPLVETAHAIDGPAAFGPQILFDGRNDKVWFAGAYWRGDALSFEHRGYGEPPAAAVTTAYETDYVTGCALFVSTETLRHVGLLDERFFLIYEEVEWCYRLRRLGGCCRMVPRARLFHKVSSSFGGEESRMAHYFTVRNELLWAELHLPFAARLRLYASALATILLPESATTFPATVPLHKRVVWSLKLKTSRRLATYRNPVHRARRAGVIDYVRRRFGDCPAWVRARA